MTRDIFLDLRVALAILTATFGILLVIALNPPRPAEAYVTKAYRPTVLAATANLNFANILAAGYEDKTITVTGATAGQPLAVSLPVALEAGLDIETFVSAANTVTVRAQNVGSIAVDAATGAYTVYVFKNN